METILPRYLTMKQMAEYTSIPLGTLKKTWRAYTNYGLNPQKLPNGRLRFDRLNIDQTMKMLRIIKKDGCK